MCSATGHDLRVFQAQLREHGAVEAQAAVVRGQRQGARLERPALPHRTGSGQARGHHGSPSAVHLRAGKALGTCTFFALHGN